MILALIKLSLCGFGITLLSALVALIIGLRKENVEIKADAAKLLSISRVGLVLTGLVYVICKIAGVI